VIQKLNSHINELDSMKKYPKELFYIGNIELLKKRKISFVGSRSANQYAKNITYQLANKLSNCGFCIVSGGALELIQFPIKLLELIIQLWLRELV